MKPLSSNKYFKELKDKKRMNILQFHKGRDLSASGDILMQVVNILIPGDFIISDWGLRAMETPSIAPTSCGLVSNPQNTLTQHEVIQIPVVQAPTVGPRILLHPLLPLLLLLLFCRPCPLLNASRLSEQYPCSSNKLRSCHCISDTRVINLPAVIQLSYHTAYGKKEEGQEMSRGHAGQSNGLLSANIKQIK